MDNSAEAQPPARATVWHKITLWLSAKGRAWGRWKCAHGFHERWPKVYYGVNADDTHYECRRCGAFFRDLPELWNDDYPQ